MNKFFAVMMLALMTGSAFAATPDPETTKLKNEIDKVDGKVTGIKNDAQAVKNDAQNLKKNADSAAKDLHDIKK
jgi:hypothetical protein